MARKSKAVSNEEIIAALLQHGTIKAAADSVGITPRTIYDRMCKDHEFRGDYASAKADIVRQAVVNINDKLTEAFEAVTDIMNDSEVNAQTRLQAAQTIITTFSKFTERLNETETFSRTERRTTEDIKQEMSQWKD